MWPRPRQPRPAEDDPPAVDVGRVRRHFAFARTGRVVTNNAATTQPPRELRGPYRRLVPCYENVHRGQSAASQRTTRLFEEAYDTIAAWLNAPSRRSIATYRNTTEAINAVMYSLLTEFRDGDNVVTTMMEHNSNFVPWYAHVPRDPAAVRAAGGVPRGAVRPRDRPARPRPPRRARRRAHQARLLSPAPRTSSAPSRRSPPSGGSPTASGYRQPDGGCGSLLLVDAAQLVPTTAVDVQALDVDYLAFSFHKLLAPFGVGVLVRARSSCSRRRVPFLYGGDMVAEGQVAPDHVGYNDLPWKYAAGTPNILGVIVSAQALRLLARPRRLDGAPRVVRHRRPLPHTAVAAAHARASAGTPGADGARARGARDVDGLTVYGPARRGPRRRWSPSTSPAWTRSASPTGSTGSASSPAPGCHCATLAHRDLGLTPSASCRLSFALYTPRGRRPRGGSGRHRGRSAEQLALPDGAGCLARPGPAAVRRVAPRGPGRRTGRRTGGPPRLRPPPRPAPTSPRRSGRRGTARRVARCRRPSARRGG